MASGKATSTVYIFSLASPFDFLCKEGGQLTPTPTVYAHTVTSSRKKRQAGMLTDLELREETCPQPDKKQTKIPCPAPWDLLERRFHQHSLAQAVKASRKPSSLNKLMFRYEGEGRHTNNRRVPLFLPPHLASI